MGDREDPGNYIPLSLMSVLGKIQEHIVKPHLRARRKECYRLLKNANDSYQIKFTSLYARSNFVDEGDVAVFLKSQ